MYKKVYKYTCILYTCICNILCVYILPVTCTLFNQTHWPGSATCEIWRRNTQPVSATNCKMDAKNNCKASATSD